MTQTTAPQISISRVPREEEDALLDKLKALLSIDFKEHDKRLLQCLHGATLRIEKETGLLLESATVTVIWRALYDYEALPYGPVVGSVAATNLSGSVLSTTLPEGDFPVLYGDFPSGVKLVYGAGYSSDTLPDDLAEAVLNLAANLFDDGDREWLRATRANSRYTWAS